MRAALSKCQLSADSKGAVEAACAAAEHAASGGADADEAWKLLVEAIVPHVAKVDIPVPRNGYDATDSCHGNAYQLWRTAFVRTPWNRALAKGMPSHLSSFVAARGWKAIERSDQKSVYEEMWVNRVREIKSKKLRGDVGKPSARDKIE